MNQFCGRRGGNCQCTSVEECINERQPSPENADALSLREALEFYADPTRYSGANGRLEGEPDKYQPANLYYRIDVTRDNGRIAREALAASSGIHAQQMREPDAWEWCACIDGKWGAWLYLDAPVESFCERNKFNLDNGTYILRPLYAFTSPESQS